ncbi:hypothetical protein AGMMS50293_15960 [Spirochaetia bacterium]|nr:hypothetical protein AGMMS50293_15960 [Spirochaetia bacterium]
MNTMMKKTALAAAILLALVLAACVPPVGTSTETASAGDYAPLSATVEDAGYGMAKLTFANGSGHPGRSLTETEDRMAWDFAEVIFYNDTTAKYYTAYGNRGDVLSITIPYGDYQLNGVGGVGENKALMLLGRKSSMTLLAIGGLEDAGSTPVTVNSSTRSITFKMKGVRIMPSASYSTTNHVMVNAPADFKPPDTTGTLGGAGTITINGTPGYIWFKIPDNATPANCVNMQFRFDDNYATFADKLYAKAGNATDGWAELECALPMSSGGRAFFAHYVTGPTITNMASNTDRMEDGLLTSANNNTIYVAIDTTTGGLSGVKGWAAIGLNLPVSAYKAANDTTGDDMVLQWYLRNGIEWKPTVVNGPGNMVMLRIGDADFPTDPAGLTISLTF